MGLVSVPNINTNDDATADLFNSRYADIVDVINGNIDAANIKDASIPYGKLTLAALEIPVSKIGLDPVVGTNSGTGGGSTNYIKIGTFLVCWGTTASQTSNPAANTNYTIVFPQAFATLPTIVAMPRENTVQSGIIFFQGVAPTTTTVTLSFYNRDSPAGTTKADWIAIGKAA